MTIVHPQTLALAADVVRLSRAIYDAEVADWYESGDGQSPDWGWDECGACNGAGESDGHRCLHCDAGQIRVNRGGQGHTYPVCIHGMSRWTDYDNICGGCEESLTEAEEAERIAHNVTVAIDERCAWQRSAPSDLPDDLRQAVLTYALEPIVRLSNRKASLTEQLAALKEV